MTQYVKLFNGAHTIECTSTGEHWTFEIKTQKPDARFHPGERLIALLTGPNNLGDWRAIGTVDEEGIHLFKIGALSEITRILWICGTGGSYPNYEHLLEGTCCKCNRRLTVPESIRTGIGPICAERDAVAHIVDEELRKKAMKLRRLRAQQREVETPGQLEMFE